MSAGIILATGATGGADGDGVGATGGLDGDVGGAARGGADGDSSGGDDGGEVCKDNTPTVHISLNVTASSLAHVR
jgi:hypothetical protein